MGRILVAERALHFRAGASEACGCERIADRKQCSEVAHKENARCVSDHTQHNWQLTSKLFARIWGFSEAWVHGETRVLEASLAGYFFALNERVRAAQNSFKAHAFDRKQPFSLQLGSHCARRRLNTRWNQRRILSIAHNRRCLQRPSRGRIALGSRGDWPCLSFGPVAACR